MTNTPSPTDEDRELIHRLRFWEGDGHPHGLLHRAAADRLESLLSDRAKLEEASPEMLEAGHSYIRSFGGLISTLELPDLYRAMVAALNRADHG